MFEAHSLYQIFHFQRNCICPSVWHCHAEHVENPFAGVKSSAQHLRTNTLQDKCSHLNLAQISSCKKLSKQGKCTKT